MRTAAHARLPPRPDRWTIFLSWEASTFTIDTWHNHYVPMTVWFDPSLIDPTLQLVERLRISDDGVDHNRRAWQFANKLAGMSAEQRRQQD